MLLTRTERKRWFAAATNAVRDHLQTTQTPPNTAAKAALLAQLQRDFPTLTLTESWLQSLLKQVSQELELQSRVRTQSEWERIFPRYPIGPDGFAMALQPDQEAEIRETLRTFGLVVVHVLDDETCQRSIDAMFEELNALPIETRSDALHPHKPWTWEQHNWPEKRKYLVSDPAFHPQAFANRSHEAIHHVFSTIWGQSHLMCNIDRWGIARGTQALPFPQDDGSITLQDRPDWSLSLTKHWDYNPWLFVEEMNAGLDPGYQGLVAFVDQDLETGCHLTLPGGMPFLAQWCEENPVPAKIGRKRRSHRPSKDDPIRRFMQPIPIRKGQLLVWSWGQLHSVTENRNHKMRLHQYIGMFPAQDIKPFYAKHENFSPHKILPRYQESFSIDSIPLTPLGQRLFGQTPW